MNKKLIEAINKYRMMLNEADEEQQQEDPSTDNGDSAETQDQQPSQETEKPEGEEPTDKVTPANAQAVQDDAALNPGTLHVADGTDTGVEINSTIVDNPEVGDGEVPPKEGEIDLKFEKGNFNAIEQSSQKYAELVQTVEQTLVPLCEKAFIELLGNSAAYKRQEFNAVPNMNGQQFKIDVDMIYHTDKYIATDVAENLIQQDQNYIINTIKPTPGISVRNVKIDCQTGDISIGVTIVK